MIWHQLLNDIESEGAYLQVVDGQLVYDGSADFLTPERLALLKEHKQEIIHFLKTDVATHPLSYGQRALWFEQQLAPDSFAYNLSIAVRIQSPVDLDLLQQAFQSLLSRHPSLRTTFSAQEGLPIQKIHRYQSVKMSVTDASSWNAEFLHEQVTAAHEEPFNLEEGPLWRLNLWSQSEGEHLLSWTIHHMIADGWSCWMVLEELQALYAALVADATSPLPPVKATYADYVTWQAQMLETEGEALWSYWRDQLAGELPILNLQTDHPRPATSAYHGASCPVALSPALTDQLRGLAKAQGITLYGLLLTAFQLLLHRYTGQDDILVGSPIAGRSRAEYASTFGFFVSPVVMRGRFAGNPTLVDCLQETRETVRGALQHQEYPFQLLVERLQPERVPNLSPIFQAMFALQQDHTKRRNGRDTPPSAGRLPITPYAIPQFEGQFDLYLDLQNDPELLSGTLKYNPDLFDSSTIQRMVGHLQNLLAGMVANPTGAISELPLLSERERHQLLVEWNDTTVDYPAEKSIHQLFEEQVARTPEATAILCEPVSQVANQSTSMTFHELNEEANQLARYLIAQGVESGAPIGICLDRSPRTMIGLLGILKAGGAYLPLDPNYPQERLTFMLKDSGAAFVVTEAQHHSKVAAAQATIIQLDTEWALIGAQSTQNPHLDLPADAPAYVIYTSGSTGEPKGVVGLHRGAVNRFDWMWREYAFEADEICCQKTTLNFVDAVWEIFGPLLQGISAVLLADDVVKAPTHFVQALAKNNVTRLVLVPSLLRTLLDSHDSLATHLPALRYCICSGETLPAILAEQFQREMPHCTLINLYGSTEVSADVTYFELSKDAFDGHVPIGRPIANTQLYLLDEAMQPVPVGVVGSLYVGGDGVAQGYLNRPELTAERFITCPSALDPNSDTPRRLYATNDRARYRADGQIEYLGRTDFQVKIRGFRIELGEVEACLSAHSGVQTVALSTWIPQADDTRLIAYIVPNPLHYPDIHELRGYLQSRLPEYMVPNNFMLVDELPLTPNGKINYQLLPEPNPLHQQQQAFVAPQTPLEKILAATFAEVLGIANVGRHDNFFELGGHSLLATQVISRVRRLRQIELPLRTLFEAPTVAEMAARIELKQSDSGLEIPPLTPFGNRAAPLSFAQERMWFIHQLAPESAAYNISMAFRLMGTLNVDLLQKAIYRLVERHEPLRTTFDVIDGKPVQRIAPDMPITLSVVNLRSMSGDEQQQEAQQSVNATAQALFDLVTRPLLRICLIQLSDAEHIIAISIHHIISDQWSNGVLGRELTAIYDALCVDETPELADLPVQYADYGQWQRAWLTGDVLDKKLAFWKEQLEGNIPLDLPSDYPRPPLKTYNGNLVKKAIPASTLDAVRRLCRQEQITPYMFFLAIFKTMLMRYSGQHDIAVGSPIANRNWYETEALMGTFVNTVVLRSQIEAGSTFKEFLHSIRELSLDAFHHQDFPFEKLVDELQPPRDLSRSPFFQVFYNVINAPLSPPEFHETKSTEFIWPESGAAQFDLSLTVSTEIMPHMMLEYNTDLFREETIVRMLGHLDELVQHALAEPNQPLAKLPMLTQPEHDRILGEWNNTQMAYPRHQCVHQLFEEQAARTPDAVALIFDENRQATSISNGLQAETLTYSELNERANQLAHYLQARGVGPEKLVAICIDRSLEMMVGLLGILKAGGAYVPLDPNYPRERLAMMLEDADVTLLLTQDHLRQVLDLEAPEVVLIDQEWPQIAEQKVTTPEITSQPHHRAYVIFTSGSTGRPKGVQIPHEALTNFLWTMKEQPGITPEDVWLSVTTLSFDIAGLELYLPIITGAKVLLTPQSSTVDGPLLAQLLVDHQVSIMQATPATWRVLLNSGWQGRSSLKILCGGEAMSPVLSEKLLGKCAELWNMYGPTETTIWSTIHHVLPTDSQILIGRPIGNTQIYILDEALNPTPSGVPGLLYIGGDGVAIGYLNRPDLTAERFIDNPFGEGKIYNTGDLARYKPTGQLECLGRIDSQVKVRGFRIELGEIEANLAKHVDVQSAAVSTWMPNEDDKRLVAYIVSATTEAPDFSELRSHLHGRLPDYMVPNNFMALDALPLTPNGKVDYKALPDPQLDATQQAEFVAPQNEAERIVAGAFCEILGIENVGRHDNFFDLGGHSLLAVQLFAHLEERYADKRLPLALLFQAPTVAQLAGLIHDNDTDRGWSLIVPLQMQGDKPPLFCIHAAGGNVLLYRDLANHFAEAGQPVYGIQSQGLDGEQPLLNTVEEMAELYVNEIQAVQPTGPYRLMGYCLGGTIAFEIAQRLTAQGQQVDFVGLLETYNWANLETPTLIGAALHQFQRIEYIARNALLLDKAQRREFLSGKLERVRTRSTIWQGSISTVFHSKTDKNVHDGNGNPAYINGHSNGSSHTNGTGGTNGSHSPHDPSRHELGMPKTNSVSERLAQIWKANDAATFAYRPSTYAGRVTQFVPQKDYLGFSDPQVGWDEIALGGVDVQTLAVYPAGMIHNPFAKKLAESIVRQIEDSSSREKVSAELA